MEMVPKWNLYRSPDEGSWQPGRAGEMGRRAQTCFQDEMDRAVDELAAWSGEGKRLRGWLLAFWLLPCDVFVMRKTKTGFVWGRRPEVLFGVG